MISLELCLIRYCSVVSSYLANQTMVISVQEDYFALRL